MTAVFVGRFEPGSPEWHRARARAIGGSEVAPILGLSPFESRFSLWHRKAGHVGPVEESPEMEWGKRLEEAVAGKFADRHADEFVIIEAGSTYHHEGRPWQLASPDRVLEGLPGYGGHELLEVKTSIYGDGWGEPGTDEIPIYYRTQVLWYLDVFGLERCHVAVLIGGHDYREFVVTYDAVEAAQLRDAARQFLDEVDAGVRPDIDDHSATYQVIKEMHPDIEPVDVELDNDLAREFIAAKAAEKIAEGLARKATARVADVMGTARRAVWDGRTIATRQVRDGGVPYVVAARNLGDLNLERSAA